MFERVIERTKELRDYYSIPGAEPLYARTESGLKLLDFDHSENPDYSGQGGLMWVVYYYKKGGTLEKFGPMDSRELREMHPEIYWNAEVDWTTHGIDIPEVA